MPKRTTTLPSKLMIAFGILLIVSLIAILFFLDHMFSQRIGEEIYLRIHNGGKAVMHVIQNDLRDLELYLDEAEARPPLKPSQKFEAFCAERNIDFLCFQPYLDEPSKTVTLCETKKQTYCQGTPKTSSPQLGALLGIETYEGLPHLEVERPTSLDGSRGIWKIGKAFTEEMIDAFRNLTAMEIFLLLRGKESPGLSTLSRETQPFQVFEDLPLEARDILNQYAVYTFRHHVNGESYQFITYPLLSLENKVIGALSVGFSLQAIISSNQSAYIISGIFVVFIILAFLGVSIAVTRYFLQPLVDLKSTVNRFLHEKQTKNQVDSHDEVSFLDESFKQLTEELRSSLKQLARAQESEQKAHRETLIRLAIAADYKDEETASHILRLSRYSEVIARKLGLSELDIELLRDASPMHDVGKIGIPDSILQKKGPLTPEEFEIMKTHPKIGASIFKNAKIPLYEACRIIALSHHEKWDGSGYPQGLKGEEIPLFARIVAVSDVFDALTTKRHYKPAYSLEKSLQIMKDGIGSHFDPRVMEAFLGGLHEIKKIMGIKDEDLTLQPGK